MLPAEAQDQDVLGMSFALLMAGSIGTVAVEDGFTPVDCGFAPA